MHFRFYGLRRVPTNRSFDRSFFKEIRVRFGVEASGIGKDKVPEIRFCNQAIIHQFVGFFYHFRHLRHISVSDVGTEDRLKTDTESVEFGSKGPF